MKPHDSRFKRLQWSTFLATMLGIVGIASYIGAGFQTVKNGLLIERTDNALIGLFGGMEAPKDKKSEVLDMLKEMSPKDIAAIMQALKNNC